METTDLNNSKLHGDNDSEESPFPGTSEKSKTSPDDLRPTSKGVENAKKRLRAFSIQKKSSLSPVTVPPPKPICTTVGAVGTVFIGKLASSKPVLKPGGIEEPLDPKKPPKPPKPGTSKLQNADYLNIQKKTLAEIEDMKRKMELVDLGIPLGLICPATNSDKAMPTKAMPPIKSMLLDPAKVDEIIRDAKKARAEGKPYKFSYEKLLPSYQNPFAKKDKEKDKEKERERLHEDRHSRDKRKFGDNYRRYSSHKDERSKHWAENERVRGRDVKGRDERERDRRRDDKSKSDLKSPKKHKDTKSREIDARSKDKDTKSKDKIDTINLSDDDDDVQVVTDVSEKDEKETDVNLKDFVVCDSWSENEEKNKESTPKKGDKSEKINTPVGKSNLDPMDQLKKDLIKEAEVKVKVEKLQPVTDSFKFEIEDDNEEEALDIFAENVPMENFAKIPLPKGEHYGSPVPMRFDYESKDASVDGMDESFLESVIAEIKQEEMDENATQDKGLVEYDISPKEEDRESVTPELDDRIREMYSSRSDCSDGLKSVDSNKSTESGFKSTESGYKSTESGYKSTESRSKSADSNRSSDSRKHEGYKSTDSRSRSNDSYKSTNSRSKSIESHKSTESSYKSESGRKSIDNGQKSMLKSTESHREVEAMAKSTVDSLETWSFILKICQPLLFRHDKNKCYKETQETPKVWFAENPKLCDCVKDRSVVYEELEMCKMDLVDSVYGTHQVQEPLNPEARGWYPAVSLQDSGPVPPCSEWEAEDSQERPTPPHTQDEMVLDREYQKFMEAVWPEVEGATKSETPRSTPVREVKKRPGEEPDVSKKKKAKLEGKLSSEGWSQESEVDEVEKTKKHKVEKVKRKRKHSPSATDSDEESPSKKKKKAQKKEKKDKAKAKTLAKRDRLNKKYLRKLKEKQEKQLKKKKKHKMNEDSEFDEHDKEKKKRNKKQKKKKLLKQKKKTLKKRTRSSSSSSDSESVKKSKKEKRKKHKKRKQTTSESNQSDELFDVNILKNIKTERLTDDEKAKNFNKKHREIINVKQLQNDFVSIQIKKEIEDVNSPEAFEDSFTEEERIEMQQQEEEKMEVVKMEAEKKESEIKEAESEAEKAIENKVEESVEVKEKDVPIFEEKEHEFKEPEQTRPPTPKQPEETSQCSSQESIISKEIPYEKDDSHLRPSSQNSNYNFHDVMQSEGQGQSQEYEKEMGYEQGNYEMYEQMAMEYQSDVASQRVPPPDEQTSGRIETVVFSRSRGEIKCDWRASDPSDPTTPTTPTTPQRPSRWGESDTAANTPQRPSRWGLKPGDVNIVLTGGSEGEQGETFQIESVVAPTVYKIQSIANRTDNNSNTGYDEAYMDMYGASDRLQYGDCFSRETTIKEIEQNPSPIHISSSLDDRINLALRTTVLGEVAKDATETDDGPDKGILVTKSLAETRSVKRVSFADGYKPGQDSDTERPPVRKKKRARRTGCPWPCPASHPDHVSLWDALPPPAPPPGSPPPPARAPPPLHMLRAGRHQPTLLQAPRPAAKFDPNSLAVFMPPEPPPGLISF